MQMRGAVALNRPEPVMPAAFYKSYKISAPLHSHWRPASCEEFRCDDFLHGFALHMDVSTELGRKQFAFVRQDKSRKCTLQNTGLNRWTATYGPGTKPFAGPKHDHRLPIGRPPRLLVVGGDWRGNPRGTPTVVHKRMEDWVDDFATHQDKLAKAQN